MLNIDQQYDDKSLDLKMLVLLTLYTHGHKAKKNGNEIEQNVKQKNETIIC